MGRSKQSDSYDFFTFQMPKGSKEGLKALAFAKGIPLCELLMNEHQAADLLRQAAQQHGDGCTVDVWQNGGDVVVALDGQVVKI